VLFGPVLLTSLLAGVVALLAPCCVSVMLPAYLATVFRRRSGVLTATLVFAAGVATVIVPLGVGASALSAAFQRWHTPMWMAGGAAMVTGGVAVLLRWSPKLPMPGGRASSGTGVEPCTGWGCSQASPRRIRGRAGRRDQLVHERRPSRRLAALVSTGPCDECPVHRHL
jgi:cytochrome c-type biogenesis protein